MAALGNPTVSLALGAFALLGPGRKLLVDGVKSLARCVLPGRHEGRWTIATWCFEALVPQIFLELCRVLLSFAAGQRGTSR